MDLPLRLKKEEAGLNNGSHLKPDMGREEDNATF